MIARPPRSPASRRRGVVLILVLSMLGLLAVIGVSFAAFSGQARSAARYYSKKLGRPQADDLIQFAVRQLINDTTNPMSALYGHGLKRDMYGNDAADNGFYDRNPDGSYPLINLASLVGGVVPETWDVTTNIPSFIGLNFTGWILTIPGSGGNVAQTFEVITGNNSGATYTFRITGTHYVDPTNPIGVQGVGLTPPVAGLPFSLDGRYRHAFNGTGMAALASNVDVAMTGPGPPALNDRGNRNPGQFANYRVSGSILEGDANYTYRPFNVNLLPADEDYDAPDLENWFLAAQSADGRTIIPSFHRPGILTVDASGVADMDYPHPSNFAPGTPEYRRAIRAISKILRPRPVDHPTAGFSSLLPNPSGEITYDVDNDGDGLNDSVWLDLGYPVQRSEDGTLYKPLFSFMAVGLNGRLPLNTAGNLNARLAVDDPNTPNFDEAGLPLYDHASHLGYSPSEINPQYALQNAFDPTDDGAGNNIPDNLKPLNSQFDDAVAPAPYNVRHIPVSLSQLRSLLTGTRLNENNDVGEQNAVLVDGATVRFHNNAVDSADDQVARNGGFSVDRFNYRAVPGRWGEADAIPPEMRNFPYDPTTDPISPALNRALNFSTSRVNLGPPGFVDMPNPVRPGQSPYPNGQYLTDGIDNNFDTVDFLPTRAARGGNFSASGPEAGRLYNDGTFDRSDAHDAANMPVLASERIRRFVTPIDPIGIGRVTRYNQAPGVSGTGILPSDIGPDGRGRVGFFHYFRPPGIPLDADDNSTLDYDSGNALIDPARNRLIPNSGGPQDPSYVLAQNRHNQFHGYQAHLFPGGSNSHLMGALPFDLSNAGASFAPRTPDPMNALNLVANPPADLFFDNGSTADYVGTFSTFLNANPIGRLASNPFSQASGQATYLGGQAAFQTTDATAVHTYPLGSPLLNDPNEMNLYWPDVNDAPFGPKDLEWLYRYGDVDGASLESRLADLAPVSFVLASDAQTRRRLFSVESWDRIDYSYANDNPAGLGVPFNASLPANTVFLAPGDPAKAPPAVQSRPQVNARFANGLPGIASASFDTLNLPNPGVSHGGRRINLNHPFPHSYDPYESVRQKWITETYETLKLVLPPQAIDTPQELAKLGQFVVNIVDYRDPDNAITIWRNPDICHQPARRVNIGGTDYDLPPSIHLPYRADGTADPYYDPSPALRLVHYGMEYQPVALNEVLGFQFNYADRNKSGPDRNSRANRLYIELVNLLTQAGDPTPTATDLDLRGWDFVLVKEEHAPTYTAGSPYFHPVYTRPDPITGQLPNNGLAADERPVAPDGPGVTVAAGQSQAVLVGSGSNADRTDLDAYQDSYRASALDPAVPAIRPSGSMRSGGGGNASRVYAVGGLRMQDPTGYTTQADIDLLAANDWPNIDKDYDDTGSGISPNSWDLIPDVNDPAFDPGRPEGLFYWLYLRRPANPLLPPDPVTNPMVVVDSIRFPFSKSNGVGRTYAPNPMDPGTVVDTTNPADDPGAVAPTQPLYSVGRPQPLRGGQLVPDPEATNQPLFVYGSTDQVRPTDVSPDNTRTRYDSTDGSGNPASSVEIRHTIGRLNDQANFPNTGDNDAEAWDYLPFNDRDFASVAELMLVPACPPGLFTKQFVERPPTLIPVAVPADANADGAVDQLGVFAPVPPPANGSNNFDWVPKGDNDVDGASEPFPHPLVRTYPYLAHEFFYTSDPSAIVDPPNALGLGATNHIVGGATGAGWHRMLEFFEVPSPVLDAVGPVAQGLNFDWYRQDRRPGQVNLNLILDEEVFFGLIDDPRLLDATNLQRSLLPAAGTLPADLPPRIVTEVDEDGSPVSSYAMDNRGFTVFSTDPLGTELDGVPTAASYPWMRMKRSFADFLKQRHGGSGFLFAFGDGVTASPGVAPNPKVAGDRPYRSLSYHDIQRTILRPATMEPSVLTTPPLQVAVAPGDLNVQDPGLKISQYDVSDATLVDPGYAYQPVTIASNADIRLLYPNPARPVGPDVKPIVPPIPPRRWFQVPDWVDPADLAGTASNAAVGSNETTEYTPITNPGTALSAVSPLVSGDYPGLFPLWTFAGTGDEMRDRSTGASAYLGGSFVGGTFTQPDGSTIVVDSPTGNSSFVVNRDMRRHPYYRTELLQKISNLTTPRTHQFAVWVTVGLFEVVKPGDRAQFIPDELGPELGSASGANVRYRSFFVLDRTRATGFNPLRPGDYRDVIVYSRRIE